uniref:ATPase H+ transporting V1 subunit H n=1 Tax=Pavo cristatus TaxID=9049 RepID=A0A8C9FDT4_PAVCR
MDIRGAVDAAVPTNIIAAKAAEVRANKVNWQSYLQGQMISGEDCEFIQRFEQKRNPEEKQELLQTEGNQCAKTFINLMTHISKEQTVQYILTMVDDMLQENHQRVCIFFDYAKRGKNTAWSYFLPMLNRQDLFTVHMTYFRTEIIVLSFVLPPASSDSAAYIHIQCSAKVHEMVFPLHHGTNLLEKSTERETRQEYALAMIQCKVLKQLENLDQQKYDDEDISEDIKFLLDKLGESVQDLSSFDEYSSELKSGRLEWSPVHKSEKFWRENAVRLNEKNYELLKILTKLLEVSDDPQVLAVAAHDVGEYVRHYPRGKRVIEQLGGKQLVMNHMHHEDQQVRYNALLAVQKLMVHNWYVKLLLTVRSVGLERDTNFLLYFYGAGIKFSCGKAALIKW